MSPIGAKIINENQKEIPMKLINEKLAAEMLGLSVKTLQKWRCDSEGPVYLKMGRAVRYRPEDLEAYVTENVVFPQ